MSAKTRANFIGGKRPNGAAGSLHKLESVSADLWCRRRAAGNWERVASALSLSVGTVVRVANGYNPKRTHIRAALDLPPLALSEVCPKCNVVHTRKTCPSGPRGPRLHNWRREYEAERRRRLRAEARIRELER